jgi:CRP-like cAMP-binding protein
VILFHTANALYLISYAVKDILWLRVITVLAGIALLGSMLGANPPPWPAVVWNLVFFVINAVRIHLLVRERRPVPLSADEQHVANLTFPSLRPRELQRLLNVGEMVDHGKGTRIVEKGVPLDALLLVVRGNARVALVDRPGILIREGMFVGEIGFLTGKPPGADVVAATELRVVRWPTEALRAYLDENPELNTTMQQVLGSDLAAKLSAG